jgi:hypothetical protein
MTAVAIDMLAADRAIGGDVKLVGPGRLKVLAPTPLPDKLIQQLRAVKPELLTLLAPPGPKTELGDSWADAEEERAATVEYDGGAPRAWAEALARLDPDKPPDEVPARRWLRFVNDCGRFLDDGWARQAAAFGWEPLDLFGCDRERPFARIDRAGLLWLLNGRKLMAFSADTATIKTLSGAHQTYRRRSIADTDLTLPWTLASLEGGRQNSNECPNDTGPLSQA